MAAVAAVTMVAPLVGSIAVGATPAFATNSPKLVFTTQQSAQILQAGQSFAVQVEVQDGSGHVITSGPGSTDSVGLAFNTYAPGVSLNCNGTNDTVNAVSGVANFSCNVTVTGDYFLGASDNTPGDIQTAFAPGSVEIIPGPATQLTFTGQPENAAINVAFPVEVTEADQYGNAEETSGDQIGLALGGGTAGAVLTCTPDGSSTPSNGAPTSFGVVDFTCSVDTAGVGYYLTASDPSASLGPVQSSGFDIGQESAAVNASPVPGVDVNGVGNFNVTFTVLDASGNPIPNRSVSASADGATGSTTTDANGSATIALSCPGVPGSFEVTATDTTTSTLLGATQESCVDLGFQGQDPIGQSDSFSLDGAAPNSPVTVSFAADANSTPVAAALSGASCSTDATGTLAYGSCYYTVPNVPDVTAPANVIALVTVGSATYQDPSFLLEEATTLQLTPSSGPPGSHIAYSVTGFAANEIVDISVGPTTYVSRCTSDPSGSCSGPLTVPSMPAGTYTAEADGETSGSFADSPFTVTSQLTLSPVSGAPGSTVAASVAGFGSNETVGFTFAGTTESSTCMTDSTGSCSTGLTVPVGASGPVTVTATGASSGDTANAPYTVSAVQLSPATGPVGTPVQVTAVGFSPSETVDIFYNSFKQTTCTASPSGSCSATITVPAGKAGNYTVIATGETSGTSVRTTFQEVAALVLTPDYGPPDSTFGANATGFLAGETVNFTVDGALRNSCTADGGGSCSVTLSAPAGGPAAAPYTITATGATSGLSANATFTEVGAQIALSPSSGPGGTTVQVAASYFQAHETVSISFDSVSAGVCTTDGSGACSTSINASPLPGGTYTVTAVGSSSHQVASASFAETPTVSVSPTSGPSGAPFQATASGFAANDTVAFSYGGSPAQSCQADSSGDCTAIVTVPAGEAGTYTVTGTGTSGLTASTPFTQTTALTLTPALGAVGTTFQALASGYQTGETVNIDFNGTLVRSCQTGTDGTCLADVTVPQLPAATYQVTAVGQTTQFSSSASFTVVPLVTLTPSSGIPGAPYTASMSGFNPDQTLYVYFGSYFAGSCAGDVTGSCSVNATVPAGLSTAMYNVQADDTTSGQSASASFDVIPGLALSPATGAPGSTFSAVATGFLTSDKIFFEYGGAVVGSCTTGSSAGCTLPIQVPSGSPGPNTVLAFDGTRNASATFDQTAPSRPALALTPSSGTPGGLFDANLSGFAAGESVSFTFDGQSLNTQCSTDASGTCIAVPLNAPASLPAGSYDVVATGASNDQASAMFQIEPALSVVPASGQQGSAFTATASGFAAGESVSFTFDGNSIPGNCQTNTSGDCTAGLNVPNGIAAGPYVVTATGGTSSLSANATYTETGSLQLAPASGSPGSSFTANAVGFAPSETVNFSFDGTTLYESCNTDSHGDCSATGLSVPNGLAAGQYIVAATGATSGDVATATYTIVGSLSLAPSSGTQGGPFDANLSGFAAGESVSFTFDGQSLNTQCSTDASGSCTAVPLTVPASLPAGSYDVVATGATNDQASATFQIEPALSVVPASGQQGSAFSAIASGFGAGESVSFTFDGSSIPGNCQTNTSGDCTAGLNVPTGIAAGPYVVTATGETSSLSANATYTELPSLNVGPSSGSPGSTFTADAVGFAPSETVNFSFHGTSLNESCVTDSHGDCTVADLDVPNGLAAGQYVVAASGATSGEVANATYTIVGSLGLAPSSGTQGGSFDANLSGFAAGESVSFTFDGQSLNTQCSTDASGSCTAIPLNAPASLPAGSYDVVATGATSDQASATFQIEPALSLAPASGQQGSAFSATASGFAASENVTFTFAGSSIPGSCQTDASGDCTIGLNVPNGIAAGPYVVTATGGTSSLSADATYTETGSLTVSPPSGPAGTPVQLLAVGFGANESVNFAFDSTALGSCSTNGTGACSTSAPAPSASVGNHTITATGGVTGDAATATFNETLSAPTVTQVSPSMGRTAGGTSVTVTGSEFVTGATVHFGTAAASNVVVNSSGDSLTATSPAGTGTVDITVTTPGGTSAVNAADQYTYLAAPTVTAVTPSSGPTAGGTVVTISGTNFAGTDTVKFGATAATNVQPVNSMTIKATAPAEAAGTVNITVTTPGGTSGTSTADHYVFLSVPTVASVTPHAGPLAGGTSVTINGGSYAIPATVSFGGVAATNVVVVTGGRITATAPPGSGTVDITVTTPGGTSPTIAADQFTYDPAPTVTQVSPSLGRTAGGTSVTVTGSGFVTGATVHFGTAAASNVVVNSSGDSLTATSPAGTGTVDITVTTPGGTSAVNAADQYTYLAAPTVTAVTPNSGPTAGGTVVTISGTNFAGTDTVKFGATAATNVQPVNSMTIKATAPAEAAGTVNITVTTPGGTSPTSTADRYTY